MGDQNVLAKLRAHLWGAEGKPVSQPTVSLSKVLAQAGLTWVKNLVDLKKNEPPMTGYTFEIVGFVVECWGCGEQGTIMLADGRFSARCPNGCGLVDPLVEEARRLGGVVVTVEELASCV